MAKITNEIIVVDLEATCWNTEPPPGEFSEIIEIGVCSLSRRNDKNSWQIVGAESIIVKPENSRVSDFCTSLTTLTQRDVNKGVSLFAACRHLEAIYDTPHKPWASWGDYDRTQLQKECKGVVRYPFGPTHWNMKDMFSLLTKLDREIGLAEAIKLCGLDFQGTQHRGVDDAINTARVLEFILPEESPLRLRKGMKLASAE